MRDLSKISTLEQLDRERELLEYRADEQERLVIRQAKRLYNEWTGLFNQISNGYTLATNLIRRFVRK